MGKRKNHGKECYIYNGSESDTAPPTATATAKTDSNSTDTAKKSFFKCGKRTGKSAI